VSAAVRSDHAAKAARRWPVSAVRRGLAAAMVRGRLVAPALALVAVMLLAGATLAADPSTGPAVGLDPPPSPGQLVVLGGDPRSEGVGPGLVGSPILVLAAVIVLGLVTALVTALAARLADRR
jgi:hypothetical protein